jgi:Uma2 family endonuclease
MSSAVPFVPPSPALLTDIDWHTYSRLLRVFAHRRLRLTYDRGALEVMTPLWEHEEPARLVGRFIDVLTEELNLPCRLGGSVTLRRRKHQRGLEADNCYWIASAPRLRGKRRLNLRVDPPPDLAVEMDLTHSSLDRMSIYATLKVPEVWRLTAGALTFHVLQGGAYQLRTHSLALRQIGATDLMPFLSRLGQSDVTEVVREFRAWLRQLLGRSDAS